MKILITGGCGFVGSNIAIYLKKKILNAKIDTLDNLSRVGSIMNYQRLKKHNIRNYKYNVSDFSKMRKIPKYNLIIDCCAEPAVEVSKSEVDRVFNTNLVGTFNVLKKCSFQNRKYIIFDQLNPSYSKYYTRKDVETLLTKSGFNKFEIINRHQYSWTAIAEK